jgi:hypothetical protein
MERDLRRRSTELSAEEFLEEERRREAVRILGLEEAKKRGVRQKDKAKEVRLLPSISPTPHAAFHITLHAHAVLCSAHPFSLPSAHRPLLRTRSASSS